MVVCVVLSAECSPISLITQILQGISYVFQGFMDWLCAKPIFVRLSATNSLNNLTGNYQGKQINLLYTVINSLFIREQVNLLIEKLPS